jgi:hypothetical protein
MSLRLSIFLKALRELGPTQVGLLALYRLGLMTGHYRRAERKERGEENSFSLRSLFAVPPREKILSTLADEGKARLLVEANEIVENERVRLFGGEPVDLKLGPAAPLLHWTEYETNPAPLFPDIKLIWEPARFGWATVLARAFYLTGDEKYAESFWKYFELFVENNPLYLGPNWISAQESALRLIAWTFCWHLLREAKATTPGREQKLSRAVAQHAERIPATLIYARAQNNNHLLSEAAGLYTAGLFLPDHPNAERWRDLGIKWLGWGFENQIDLQGEYVQHSTNYQRLILQLALWVCAINAATESPGAFAPSWLDKNKLALAAQWLAALVDPVSGHIPNLGANDGAYIFPVSSLPFDDYRPVVQAASLAFCDRPALESGSWDEMALWFYAKGFKPVDLQPATFDPSTILRASLKISTKHSWAYLRAVHFDSRPSHADQLHVDLWWRGLNVAQDAGTFRYNDDAPWDNALACTRAHNTVSVDDADQMTRAGRFLFLDWAQARILERTPFKIATAHNGYRRFGVTHQRTLSFTAGQWIVRDGLTNRKQLKHTFTLHWLLPDWEFEMIESGAGIRLKSPYGWITLRINLQPFNLHPLVSLARAGEVIDGEAQPDPTRGWVSPTYETKQPALSLACKVVSSGNVNFISEFNFPEE